jgi:iron complex outermembrane receptor protein
MNRLVKTALLAGAAWTALSGVALAQNAQPASEGQEATSLGEVVVTARRRAEALQDVPVAVTAITAETLENKGSADITELARSTPSLTLNSARGSNSTLISFIRGVGQQDPLWGFDPGVGLYIDDVYVARPQAAVLDIFDVERIEVLRGPQGTLYGRNTIGGAIKYVTRRIGDEPSISLQGAYGSYDQFDAIANVSGPVSDTVGISFGVARYLRDGFGTNLNTGTEHYNKDVTAARASVEWTPTDSLFFRVAADWVQDSSNARHGHREFAPILASEYDTRAGAGDKNDVQTRGVSLTGEYVVNDMLTLKSITAYRDGETRGNIDFDNLPTPILDIPAQYDDDQFSQEFQALLDGDNWSAVAGVFYMDATASGAFDTVVGLANLTTLTSGSVDTKSWSVFGDLTYDFTDQLSLSVGGRFTSDEKTGTVFRQQYLGIRSPFFGNTAAVPLGLPRTNYTRTRDFEEFTPRVSLSYEITPDLTTYASWGRGFKSGGFDMRGDAVLYPNTVDGYDPETVETIEIGLKGTLFDRFSFATAIFDSSYEDQQITTQYPAGATVASVVDNVGSSSIRGWEFEGSLRATENLVINGMVSYIDAQFDEFLAYIPTGPLNATCPTLVGCFVDVSNARDFQNTPEWTGSIGATYTHWFEDGSEIAITPSAAYRGAYQQFETASPLLDQDAYWMYDASAVWTSASDRWTVGFHGKNLSDERYRTGGYSFPGALTGDSLIAFYGAPRTFTARVGYKF